MRSHCEERLFTCDVCSQQFTEQRTLKQHKRVHSGERPVMMSAGYGWVVTHLD